MTQSEAIERGRLLFAQECRFLRPIVSLEDVPDTELPEAAFIGRSNVGKSSLINALTGRNALARVSNTPGRTREINLFDLGRRLILADLPAMALRASPRRKARPGADSSAVTAGRPQLARVCLLIDSRHGVKDSDEAMMDLLDGAAVSFQVILTKSDKIDAAELANVLTLWRRRLKSTPPDTPRFSSRLRKPERGWRRFARPWRAWRCRAIRAISRGGGQDGG